KKRAAEIFDEALFKQPPPRAECPICFLRLPLEPSGMRYQACCGKIICCGCAYANVIAKRSILQICPFCRDAGATSEDDLVEKIKKRVEVGDATAMHNLGCSYLVGGDREFDVPQDSNKALELLHQAAKLGCAESHCSLGDMYFKVKGEGVEKDVKKGKYHWEQAAMGGNEASRYNLGIFEGKAGNVGRAMKHLMISVEFGHDNSLKAIQEMFSMGAVTKDDFEKALRAHK
ncbi:hypothetical protein ACHAXR_000251, partial [Thalassiosira sp. AJA248-18]